MNIKSFLHKIQGHFRRNRMKLFESTFGIKDTTRIIDVGGLPWIWTLLDRKPEVTMVNLEGMEDYATQSGYLDPLKHKMITYSGKVVPFPDNSFDICYSNSVIEHVGDSEAVAHFASEIRRLAPRYFVQTPNRWFIMEPHFICLFVHWLPLRLKRPIIGWFSLYCWIYKAGQKEVDELLHDITLLSVKDMRRLFPDAEIVRERFLGLTKSIIAVKR